MAARRDELRIAPELREVWRPFYVFGPMAVLAVSCGAIATAAGEPDGLGVGLFVGVTIVLFAAARTLVWRLIPGSVCVVLADDGLQLRRFGRIFRRHAWVDVESAHVEPGDRWPEWNTWAGFAQLQIVRRDGSRVSSPSILIVRSTDVDAVQKLLDEQLERHAAGSP
ncbi:hypothetical protein DQ244_14235 [Blastococcus sp. TBT05-19]|uniref:hypothetical protein n=1 Tax=Blastococcus sp. TBT05-19 TaxID=2250581 RepID=UPI000DEB14D6|nr:hypothetical protein [Blastococcus sp. TBT05-19]RBY88947.1 hypothetical protein DQ244_14235 [Blastococcus sp. TBT05-19]